LNHLSDYSVSESEYENMSDNEDERASIHQSDFSLSGSSKRSLTGKKDRRRRRQAKAAAAAPVATVADYLPQSDDEDSVQRAAAERLARIRARQAAKAALMAARRQRKRVVQARVNVAAVAKANMTVMADVQGGLVTRVAQSTSLLRKDAKKVRRHQMKAVRFITV